MGRWLPAFLAILATLPGLLIRFNLIDGIDPVRALWYGVAIVGAAFMLSWAAEALQIDVSAGLALALLALIAILPEYVVDASFALLAAEDPSYAGYAVANMTGANRLLIGLAWPLVVAIVWIRSRQRQITLAPSHGLEIVALLAATLYAFILPFKGDLTLVDFAVLASIFVVYVWRLARQPVEEVHLVGPAMVIGELPTWRRRLVTSAFAAISAAVILLVAKPFAQALIGTGATYGVDEFLLVQWVAPLASEAPEFVVVSIFAWRLAGESALGTLISSKVNQWTLLVAMLPLVYAVAMGGPAPFPLDARQGEEVLLTAAQSLFAVALLLGRRLTLTGAGLLFGLFALQLVLPDIRNELSYVYIALAIVTIVVQRKAALRVVRDAFASPADEAQPPLKSAQPRPS
jgi:cation:H+ antiporter